MTQEVIPAREIIVQVAESDGTTWTEVQGLKSVKINPGENGEAADSTRFSSQGAYEEYMMQRGASLTLEGLGLMDTSTAVVDPGQARCDALGATVGLQSRGTIRFRYPTQTSWKVWSATFKPGETGGGTNDLSAWMCTITRCGLSTTVAVS